MISSFYTRADDFTWNKLIEFTDNHGLRPAGSKAEKQSKEWLINQYKQLGLTALVQPFTHKFRNKKIQSANVEIEIKGRSNKTIIVGAHYDSIQDGSGSLGFTDNASGAIALLGLANALKEKTLPFTVRLISFGAEEVGLLGSKAYVKDNQSRLNNVIGMINLDTIIGGDKLYIHSASTTPYRCHYLNEPNYNNDTALRDALISSSTNIFDESAHQLHPANQTLPQGETASWSDHAPFACTGIPIAYIEATNFSIDGKDGHDGYSQTVNNNFWSCFNKKEATACNRKKEQQWGQIWHTKFDSAEKLRPIFDARLQSQMNINLKLLKTYLTQPNKT
ncbi:Zn-dependent exopeptidase M28 [Parashewanella spongiae]|uniref:Zn-dependent exopeptidase M28 n=1 Tax=Parashewanella spongiae TaxID=342950 RepID=A0A3A6TGK1_9GAMM|nr:Zn-dependent exopeptidase M28 [Parashewanella spongiae]